MNMTATGITVQELNFLAKSKWNLYASIFTLAGSICAVGVGASKIYEAKFEFAPRSSEAALERLVSESQIRLFKTNRYTPVEPNPGTIQSESPILDSMGVKFHATKFIGLKAYQEVVAESKDSISSVNSEMARYGSGKIEALITHPEQITEIENDASTKRFIDSVAIRAAKNAMSSYTEFFDRFYMGLITIICGLIPLSIFGAFKLTEDLIRRK